ncbi:PREDICTED: NF-kappa-B inhibitor-interacting Ras-like protein 2 isoform X1 [Myotis davidii]|uniref:NF-kappa-B inhibitor-interacting Ras-like protein 2 isoform X1 n=2 Tax=Myotis davidii TaxID=225400 RepID=UPI000767226F|nr:PREDICTED: NF-kappa-B inhibitor-interacting Ras-like protein 2 isoform X1 [Myotis davidii]
MGKSCKVVVCGQASVGKTSILEQLLYGNHVVGSEMIETQEDIYVGSIETDRGVREQVRFYDTRGLRDGTELPRHCFSCTDGYVLVYSTDSRESFQRVELLKKEIDKSKDKKEVTIVVLGNKCDLQEQRRVDPDVAQHWAKSEKVKLWEVSVADRRSLLEPFIYLASKMTQPQSKSAFPLSRATPTGPGGWDSALRQPPGGRSALSTLVARMAAECPLGNPHPRGLVCSPSCGCFQLLAGLYL